jgi:hypothetical protein
VVNTGSEADTTPFSGLKPESDNSGRVVNRKLLEPPPGKESSQVVQNLSLSTLSTGQCAV